jgi:hypothetical protein
MNRDQAGQEFEYLRKLDFEMLQELNEVDTNSFGKDEKTFLGGLLGDENEKLKPPTCSFLDCKETKIIGSHSLSKAVVLEKMSHKKQVFIPVWRFGGLIKREPQWKTEVIENATIFHALCSTCDQKFSPIDRDPSVDNDEHLFLMAYRAVYFKYYQTWSDFLKYQRLLYKLHNEKKIDGNDPPPGFMVIFESLVRWLWHFKEQKEHLDNSYNLRDWSQFKHRIIRLENQHPTVAACDAFGIDDPEILHGVYTADEPFQNQRTTPHHPFQNNTLTTVIAFNIFPKDNDIFVVLSSIPEADVIVAPYWRRIEMATEEHYQKYLISKFMLRNCGNFVLNPSYFNEMSQKQKKAILKYWEETHQYSYSPENSAKITEVLNTEDQNLYLF